MGSDESRFNVSLILRDKVTRQCPHTTAFEEKGEPKFTSHRLTARPNRLTKIKTDCMVKRLVRTYNMQQVCSLGMDKIKTDYMVKRLVRTYNMQQVCSLGMDKIKTDYMVKRLVRTYNM